MQSVNILTIAAATIVSMALGFLWYSDYLFGKAWAKLSNNKMDKDGSSMYVIPTICFLALNSVFAYLLSSLKLTGLTEALVLGFFLWLGFSAVAIYVSNVFQQKSLKLFLIDSGYILACILASSILLTLLK